MAVKGLRNITVLGKVWRWKAGRDVAMIYSPEERRYVVRLDKVTGLSMDVIARGQWKRTSDGMVRPSEIRTYIETRLA